MDAPFDLNGKRVWVAGHNGMVGSAIVRRLAREACTVLKADRRELDLTRQADVESWMAREKPDAVFMAAPSAARAHAPEPLPANDARLSASTQPAAASGQGLELGLMAVFSLPGV